MDSVDAAGFVGPWQDLRFVLGELRSVRPMILKISEFEVLEAEMTMAISCPPSGFSDYRIENRIRV
jgi:hypothetical protein